MAKHFRYQIREDGFTFTRDEVSIAREAAVEGIYVIRTNAPEAKLEDEAVVRAYKDLAEVAKAFRIMKAFPLEVAPVRHRLEGWGRAPVFLCMMPAMYAGTWSTRWRPCC